MNLVYFIVFFFGLVSTVPIPENLPLDSFRITVPLGDTVYKKGEMGHVAWVNGIEGLVVVKLLYGKDRSSLTASNWAPTVQTVEGSGNFSFFINSYFNVTDMYRFQLVFNKNGQSHEYLTPYFKVI